MDKIVFGLMALKNVMLSRATSRINRLKDSDEGVTAVEYALIIGLIAVVIIAAVSALGGGIGEAFRKATCAIQNKTWNGTACA